MKRSDVLAKILRRSESMFIEDLSIHAREIRNKVMGARILIIGAAGSIGSAFVKQLLPYNPFVVHLIDINENNLVELVRDIRSSTLSPPDDFKTFAIAMGSLEFERFLNVQRDYDYVLNFSALKHVRSEKDPYSLMRMYNANVYHVRNLLESLIGTRIKKHFSVSSDKATNPVSIMGATKIFMERVLLTYSNRIAFSTARFANVAFSDGSLLYGFQQRLLKRQPFSAPYDVQRYFISHEEAAQLCLLSCFLGNNREIYFPVLHEQTDMLTFSEIAVTILEYHGLEPEICGGEEEARDKAQRLSSDARKWPCYFFGSDTTGEKAFEEFFTETDKVNFDKYKAIGVISQPFENSYNTDKAMDAFDNIKRNTDWRKEDMVNAIKIAVPELAHEEKNRNLDQKM